MYSALYTLNTTTEVPLSKAPNPQLLPGRRSINGCPLLRAVFTLCVRTLDGINAEHKFRVWVTILGRMSLHSLFISSGVTGTNFVLSVYVFFCAGCR